MAFDNGHSQNWTAPNVWGTAPPKSPTVGVVSSFLGHEYTPSSPPSLRSRPRTLTLRMNPFSSSASSTSPQPPTTCIPPTPLQPPEEEGKRPYPTLSDVLHNLSPPPYTLSSFMAYLSMMHSLETLEFLLDTSRYRSIHQQAFSNQSVSQQEVERLRTTWNRLIDAYVRPGGSREVNLPSHVRDRLLQEPAQDPAPNPELLDPSINHVYNLMRDSILPSFFASYASSPGNCLKTPTTARSEFPFTRNMWNKPAAGLFNRSNSGSSGTSTKSSSTELMSPVTSVSSTSQPISIPYPVSTPHRGGCPHPSRSMAGFMPQSISSAVERSSFEAWLENTQDEMSDVDEGSVGRNSSSGRQSPMTPPLTPPPQGEGSPIKEGGIWSRRVREKFRLRKN